MKGMNLKLNHPCAYDWNELEAGNDKRHCNACGKFVIDFTHYSEAQLLDYFKQKPSHVCGYFTEKQIQQSRGIGAWIKPALRYAAVVIAGVFSMQTVQAQANKSENTPAFSQNSDFKIKGLILLENTKKPAANATITISAGSEILLVFQTDKQGKYNINLDSFNFPNQVHITILSEDKRVQYEEDVLKNELFAFFNRAIPFYETTLPEKSKNSSAINSSKHKKRKWNPFKKKVKYHRRSMGCPEF